MYIVAFHPVSVIAAWRGKPPTHLTFVHCPNRRSLSATRSRPIRGIKIITNITVSVNSSQII